MSEGYTESLFGCLSDCGNCCCVMSWGWTCIPSATNWAGSLGEGCECCHCCSPVSPIWTRANIRARKGIFKNNHVVDALLYCCCFQCATCQDARELKWLRGPKGGVDAAQSGVKPAPGTAPPTGPPIQQPPGSELSGLSSESGMLLSNPAWPEYTAGPGKGY
jgi:hypothetical protein